MGLGLPDSADRHYVLYNGMEPVVQAQVMWERLKFFDAIMESGEGTFHAHMDLTDTARKSVAWKAGTEESIAGFTLQSEGIITCTGWIATAIGRNLAWAPIHDWSYEYVIFQPGGPRLFSMAAIAGVYLGDTPGRMIVYAEGAADPELGGLVVLGFAVANEQTALLHREPPNNPDAPVIKSPWSTRM